MIFRFLRKIEDREWVILCGVIRVSVRIKKFLVDALKSRETHIRADLS